MIPYIPKDQQQEQKRQKAVKKLIEQMGTKYLLHPDNRIGRKNDTKSIHNK
jgi:hypothetical protein